MKKNDIIYFNTAGLGIPPSNVLTQMSKMHYELYSDPRKEEIFRRNIIIEKKIIIDELFRGKNYSLSYLRNASEALMIASNMFSMTRGDEVIITSLDHRSCINQWTIVCDKVGAKLSTLDISINASEEEILLSLNKKITNHTKIIIFPHVDRNFGVVFPVKKICDIAKSNGIFTIVDGAQSTGLIELNVDDYECDVYLGSFHKWFAAPLSLGYILVHNRIFESIDRTYACGERYYDQTISTRELGGDELGTRNLVIELLLPILLKYHKKMPLRLHDEDLIGTLLYELKKIKGIKIHPTSMEKRGILSFFIENVEMDCLIKNLIDKHNIIVGDAKKYNQTWIRLSIDENNTLEEIMRFIKILRCELE